MKKFVSTLFVLTLAVCMLIPCLAGCAPTPPPVEHPIEKASFVSIDINPSIDLVVDADNKVMSIVAKNEDAEVLLVNTDLKGKSVDIAINSIINLSFQMGYITKENSDVKIYGINAKGEVNEELVNKIKTDVKNASLKAQEKVEEGKKIAVETTTEVANTIKRRYENFKKEIKDGNATQEVKQLAEKLTLGKYILMETVVEISNGCLTMQKAIAMNTAELNKKIYELNQKCEVVVAGLVEDFETKSIEIINNAQTKMDEIYSNVSNLFDKAILSAKKTYIDAQKKMTDLFNEINVKIAEKQAELKVMPTDAQKLIELENKVNELAVSLFPEDTAQQDALKQNLYDTENDKYTYLSVAKGLAPYYDEIGDKIENEAKTSMENALDYVNKFIDDSKNTMSAKINEYFDNHKVAITNTVKACVAGVNAINTFIGLPKLDKAQDTFNSPNEMYNYISSIVITNSKNIEDAFYTYFTERIELTPEQKSAINEYKQSVIEAYDSVVKDYKDAMQAKKDAIINANK